MRFAQRLKHLRKELKLKQSDIANACNVKLTAISKYENEIIKPGFDMLAKMGLAYNVNLNWLVNEIGSMFIETSQRKLIKEGSTGFFVEVDEQPKLITVKTENHNLDLTNDLKVEYYGIDDENYTKIYHKNGEVEFCQYDDPDVNLQNIMKKLKTVCKNINQYEFIMTAINSLSDENALKELKVLIKGMELSKKF